MKAEETLLLEKYRKYQHETQGLDIWEEGAFRAGWSAHEEHATNQVEQLKNLLSQSEAVEQKTVIILKNQTIDKLREENERLKKERDEDLKRFYKWVIFENDSLPTNSTDLDALLSEYKKSLPE